MVGSLRIPGRVASTGGSESGQPLFEHLAVTAPIGVVAQHELPVTAPKVAVFGHVPPTGGSSPTAGSAAGGNWLTAPAPAGGSSPT